MRLEAPQDLEGRGEYPHNPIIASQEETFRSRAHTADLVVVEKGLAIVVWWFNLIDFEEIERFPLQDVSMILPPTEDFYLPKSMPFSLMPRNFMLFGSWDCVARSSFGLFVVCLWEELGSRRQITCTGCVPSVRH